MALVFSCLSTIPIWVISEAEEKSESKLSPERRKEYFEATLKAAITVAAKAEGRKEKESGVYLKELSKAIQDRIKSKTPKEQERKNLETMLKVVEEIRVKKAEGSDKEMKTSDKELEEVYKKAQATVKSMEQMMRILREKGVSKGDPNLGGDPCKINKSLPVCPKG
jgi:hypothetical protein